MEWLKAIRKKKGMSQQQVATYAFLTQPSYCNVENGKKMPGVDTAKRIAGVLDFCWTRFFEDEGKKGGAREGEFDDCHCGAASPPAEVDAKRGGGIFSGETGAVVCAIGGVAKCADADCGYG